MKKKVKIFFYCWFLSIVLYPLLLIRDFFNNIPFPNTLEAVLIDVIVISPLTALIVTIIETKLKKGEKRINKLENNFKFLMNDFNFEIVDKEILSDIVEYTQIIYTNDTFKITISAKENIRIIIQYAETLAVYCDKKDFFDDSQEEHSYKEILNESTKWLQNELNSLFHADNSNNIL